MSRLDVARANITTYQKDRLFFKGEHEKEKEGLAKLASALALIREAQADFAMADLHQAVFVESEGAQQL